MENEITKKEVSDLIDNKLADLIDSIDNIKEQLKETNRLLDECDNHLDNIENKLDNIEEMFEE